MERITSPQNAKVKLAASLKQKKYRDATGLCVLEGFRLSEEAAKAGWPLQFCLCTEAALHHPRAACLLERLTERQCPVYCVAAAIFAKVGDTVEPQGILLVLPKPCHALAELLAAPLPLSIVVLDALQDPGNVGAIIRTADAAGCSGVVLLEQTVDLYAAKTLRATMGSIFHLPVIDGVRAQDFLNFAAAHNLPLLATALDQTAKSCYELDFCQSSAIVFGNEGNGVSDSLLEASTARLFIPMIGRAESLNVAAAASIVIYEGLRQRLP